MPSKVLTTSELLKQDQISMFVIDLRTDDNLVEVGIGACGWYKAYDGTATYCTTITRQHTGCYSRLFNGSWGFRQF